MTDITDVCKWLLVLSGFVFFFLAAWLPYRIDQMREHSGREGASADFTPGFESLKDALTSLITAFSILSTISFAFIVIPFTTNNNISSPFALPLGVLTLITFSSGIVLSLYFYLIRPLSGTVPSPQDIYLVIRILLFGLGLTMCTITALIHNP